MLGTRGCAIRGNETTHRSLQLFRDIIEFMRNFKIRRDKLCRLRRLSNLRTRVGISICTGVSRIKAVEFRNLYFERAYHVIERPVFKHEYYHMPNGISCVAAHCEAVDGILSHGGSRIS